jgi:hypothetical protein
MASHPMQFAAPPRRVPLSLKIVNFLNPLAQLGWGILGLGMLFFWFFGANADFSFITFAGDHPTVRGTITSVESTHASEDGGDVHANHYEYSVAGQSFRGVSYDTGGSTTQGEAVTVEYADGNPARSRIAGMRRALFGPFAAIVAIFPLIGLAIVVPAELSGKRRNRMLRDGIFTTGKLAGKAPMNVTVNGRTMYELTFAFNTRDGRKAEAKARTSDTARLEDDAHEPLLYDPDEPTYAYLLDELPSRPEVEPNGDLRGRPGAAMAALILPSLIAGVNVLVLVVKLNLL